MANFPRASHHDGRHQRWQRLIFDSKHELFLFRLGTLPAQVRKDWTTKLSIERLDGKSLSPLNLIRNQLLADYGSFLTGIHHEER